LSSLENGEQAENAESNKILLCSLGGVVVVVVVYFQRSQNAAPVSWFSFSNLEDSEKMIPNGFASAIPSDKKSNVSANNERTGFIIKILERETGSMGIQFLCPTVDECSPVPFLTSRGFAPKKV
jgi:hypothetical protein